MKLTTRQMHEELNELEAKKVLEPGGCVVRCSKCGTANKVEVQTKIESSKLNSAVSGLQTVRPYVGRYAKFVPIAVLAWLVGGKLYNLAMRSKCYKCGTPL